MNDPDSARRWLENQLLLNLARFEAPLLLAHCQAAAQDDWPRLLHLAAEHRASRETRELQLESRQMGYSLAQLLDGLPELDQPGRDCLAAADEPGLPWLGAGRPRLADRTRRCTGRLAVGLAGKSAGGADEDPAAGAAGGAAVDLAAVAGPEPGAAGSESAAGSGLGRRAVWIGADQHGA